MLACHRMIQALQQPGIYEDETLDKIDKIRISCDCQENENGNKNCVFVAERAVEFLSQAVRCMNLTAIIIPLDY